YPTHRDDRTRSGDLVDVDHVVAASNPEVARLACAFGECLQDRPGKPDEVQTAHRRPCQADQSEPDPVALREPIALQETAVREHGGQARGGRLVDPELASELADPELTGVGDELERRQRTVHRLERTTGLVAHPATPSGRACAW